MIEKVTRDRGAVEIRFVVSAAMADGEIGVAGDFNNWDPAATPLQHDGDGRSATVVLQRGRDYAFRYCADGRWFNDDAADRYEPNEVGGHNGIIDLTDV